MRTLTFWPLGRLFALSLWCDQGLSLGTKKNRLTIAVVGRSLNVHVLRDVAVVFILFFCWLRTQSLDCLKRLEC